MAKRRCISIDFYESENFLEMSDKLKMLYTMLLLHCDDEGIIVNPMMVTKIMKASKRHLQELIDRGFILSVDGVYVLRHWFWHNHVQPSKKNMSIYVTVLDKLRVNKLKEYEVVSGKNPEEIRNNLTKVNSSQFNTTELNSTEDNMNLREENLSSLGSATRSEILSMSAEEIARHFESRK